jgi:serine/threonine protein kinase
MDDPPSSRSKRDSLAGEIVAGHQLVHVLAAGGMGEVYLARHLALGMVRAVKVIRADLRERDRSRERFAREAQVLARLQHNSIVQIIEFGSLANGWPFLAMEYIDGPNLDQVVDRAPLPLPHALVVLEQLVLALHYAHSLGVIHRDLKPSNVLVRSGDLRQAKIIDFGLARLIDEDTAKRLTADGQMIGSPAYMAPEQVDGERDVTAAVDIYALAGIAYTLLSGRPPFVSRTSMDLMNAHVKTAPPRLAERCSDIPDFLDSLLYACLAKDPAHRPRGDELASHLGRLARGIELGARDGAAAPRAEVIAPPAAETTSPRNVAALVLDAPPPADAGGVGLSLVTKIMAMIGEIASYLSSSDPALTSLIRLEAGIREQLGNVERERAAIAAKLELAGPRPPSTLAKQRDAFVEQARTLRAQQIPLQRRMVEVVEGHRRYATGPIKSLFDRIDSSLDELEKLRTTS